MENDSQWDACALKVEKMRKFWANIFTGKTVVKINTVQIALIAGVMALCPAQHSIAAQQAEEVVEEITSLERALQTNSTSNSSQSTPVDNGIITETTGLRTPRLKDIVIEADRAKQNQTAEPITIEEIIEDEQINEPVTIQAEPEIAPIIEEAPAEIVPPYGQKYQGPDIPPLLNLSQATTWIIFAVICLLAILLFGWILTRRLKDVVSARDREETDLFHARDDESYSFDDTDDYGPAELNEKSGLLDTDPIDPDMDANLETGSLQDAMSIDISDHDGENENEFTQDEDAQKTGFLSRLFSSNRNSNLKDDDALFVESEFVDPDHNEFNEDAPENHEIIDVEPEPLEEGASTFVSENTPEIPDEPEYEEITETVIQEATEETDSDPFFQMSDPLTITEPEIDVAASNESLFEKDNVSFQPQPFMDVNLPQTPEPELPAEIVQSLNSLEAKQSESSQAINELQKQFSDHSTGTKNELSTIRNETDALQTNIDRKMETKFSLFANNMQTTMQTNLSQTEKMTAEKISQVENMNTKELKSKLLELDKKFIDQSRAAEMNFNRVLRRLETIDTPTPQLTKLTNDTTELKNQLAQLQQAAKEQQERELAAPDPAPVNLMNEQYIKERDMNNGILRKLEASLNEQTRSLRDFRQENRALSGKFDTLNNRIDRMESDLQSQRSSLIEVLERYNQDTREQPSSAQAPSQTEPSSMDALGISTPLQPGMLESYNSKPFSSHQSDTTSAHVTQDTHSEPAAFNEPQPSENYASYENGYDYNPHPSQNEVAPSDPAAQSSDEDLESTITPIVFSMDDSEPAAAPTASNVNRNPETNQNQGKPASAKLGVPKPAIPAVQQDNERTIRPLTFNMSTNTNSGQTDR